MIPNDDLRDAWASLGIAFQRPTKITVDPESALIALVQSNEFPDDKKMMGLALLWLTQYSKLVHVERLKTLAKKLSPHESATLGAIASKCAKDGDHRWKAIVKLANQVKPTKSFSTGDGDSFIKMRGLDAEFAEFGIRIAPLLPDDPKKFCLVERY